MQSQGRIVATPDTLFGKPRIANTRISVKFVLDLLPQAGARRACVRSTRIFRAMTACGVCFRA